MKTPDNKALERRLARQSYQAIDHELQSLSSAELLTLLDSKSIKVGDTAAGILFGRKATRMLIGALLQNRLRTAVGRIRATNVLNWFGRAAPSATDACIHCLDDRSVDVLDNALFGIVFAQRRDLTPELKKRCKAQPTGSARRNLFREAIKALEADDPYLFAADFCDSENIWCLDGTPPGKPRS